MMDVAVVESNINSVAIADDPLNEKKSLYRSQILDYIGNPNNQWPTREYIASDILRISKFSLYKLFDPLEIAEIERDSLAVRRSNYSADIAEVDKGLLKAAKKGKAEAIKLVYQRFEGWSEKTAHEFTGPGGGSIKTETTFKVEFVDPGRPESKSIPGKETKQLNKV